MASTFLSTIGRRIREFSQWAQKFDGSSPSASLPPLPSTLRDDLAALQRMVVRIEAVLHDAEEREIHDVSVQLWLAELRNIAYDADDVLDEYEYELLRAKAEARIQHQESPLNPPGDGKRAEQVRGSAIPSPLNTDVLFWGRIASKIREIRKDFDEISRQRDDLHLREEDGRRLPRNLGQRPPSSSVINVSDVHIQGRERDLDRLINGLLLSDTCSRSNLTVIPVFGMPGVGKTTLVQHVYHNPDICEHFKIRGWVCVSDDFDVIKLTKKIIESFSNAACDLSELDALQRKLMEEFGGKRFLLVLDDVWNDDSDRWNSLQSPLSYGEKGSAVITTTRSEKTARIMQTVPFHSLKCLSDDNCWAIFQRFAFHGLNPSDNEELVEIGKKIVQRCKGLPLAARALGSMLRFESEVDSWEDVLRSEIWELDGPHSKILPALMLSYLHLPPHLKRCFVYCSLFPKDYRFQADELVLLWMAHGYILCKARKQLERIGATYVDELMQRSFFQYYDSKNTSTFVMHDLIHDLAQYNSKGEYCRIERDTSFDLSRTRHLSIASRSHDIATVFASPTCSGLRTLHLFSVNEIRGLPNMIISNFKGLRTLILRYQQIDELPDSVGELKHLRYLDLSGTGIVKLPEAVCSLYHLQTLLLRSCKRLESVPKDISKLTNLACLEFSRYL